MQETWVRSLSCEDPLENEMMTHSSILAWEIPWTGEPGRLQSMGLQRIRHDLVTKPPPQYKDYCNLEHHCLFFFFFLFWKLVPVQADNLASGGCQGFITYSVIDALCYLALALESYGTPTHCEPTKILGPWASQIVCENRTATSSRHIYCTYLFC